jgi:hypothetical protein
MAVENGRYTAVSEVKRPKITGYIFNGNFPTDTSRARTERLFGKLMDFSFFGPEVPSSIFFGKIEKILTTTHATLGGAG